MSQFFYFYLDSQTFLANLSVFSGFYHQLAEQDKSSDELQELMPYHFNRNLQVPDS